MEAKTAVIEGKYICGNSEQNVGLEYLNLNTRQDVIPYASGPLKPLIIPMSA